jgi:putative membrane protein
MKDTSQRLPETTRDGQDDTKQANQTTTRREGGDGFPRDHLANERTLLAWGRTGIALMGLGFVVARFGLLIRELGPSLPHHLPIGTSTAFGTALVVLGAALLAVATLRYLRIGQAIESRAFQWSPLLGVILGALLVLAGVLLAIYLILTA